MICKKIDHWDIHSNTLKTEATNSQINKSIYIELIFMVLHKLHASLMKQLIEF